MPILQIHTDPNHAGRAARALFAEATDPMWWDPFAEPADPKRSFDPPVDIAQFAGQLIIRADVPGVHPEDLDVTVTDHRLVLSGNRRLEDDEKAAVYVNCERSSGEFVRTILLPEDVDTSRSAAEVTDGVLRVTIPRLAGWDPVP